MRHILSSFLAIALVFLLNGCSSKDPDRYYSAKDDFSIKLPDKWETKEGYMGTSVMSLSSLEGAGDQFRENVNVVVEKLPKEMTLDEYMSGNLSNLPRFITDFRESGRGGTTLGDIDAKWLTYTGRMGTSNLAFKQYFMVRGDRGYVITGTATEETYPRFKNTFEQTAESFQFE